MLTVCKAFLESNYTIKNFKNLGKIKYHLRHLKGIWLDTIVTKAGLIFWGESSVIGVELSLLVIFQLLQLQIFF